QTRASHAGRAVRSERQFAEHHALVRLGGARRRATIASPRDWRLATRVTALVVALLVPLLVLVVASYAQLIGERRAAEVDAAETIAETLAVVVDGFARDIEGTTLAAALALGGRDGPIDQ